MFDFGGASVSSSDLAGAFDIVFLERAATKNGYTAVAFLKGELMHGLCWA